jgi:AcrR family transcriptional regulator
MSPRAYTLGQRQAAADQTRSRIVAAARELLADEGGVASGAPAAPSAAAVSGFTVEAVARRAGVARMTVYYQFKSKRGVLEALFDDLANRGLMPHLRPVFHESVPARALDGLIGAFAAFWESDRVVLRRARALAALDPEIGESVRARDERRREHLRNVLGRLWKDSAAAPTEEERGAIIDVLHMLTSFETYDALRSAGRTMDEATRLVRRLASASLRVDHA